MRRRMWLGSRALPGRSIRPPSLGGFLAERHRDVPQSGPRVGTIDARPDSRRLAIVANRRYKGV